MNERLPDPPWRQRFRRRLRSWFDRAARDLPWRRTRDPYAIWISEVMLQQTQVATVVPYYQRFLAAFPDVHRLAAASEEQVLRLWEGLGYYRRARQLHQAARIIVNQHDGRFPTEIQAARALPGIGRYTAGAILSIAHDAPHPILEANTVRLLSRLLAFRGDPGSGSGQKLLWQFAEQLLPRGGAGAFNQALMELGSEVCGAREPDCAGCPVVNLCATFAQGLQDQIPRPKKRTPYEQVHEACVIVWRGNQVLVRRCAAGERWSGLWDFPRFPIQARRGALLRQELTHRVAQQTGVTIRPGRAVTTLKHGVTRFRITLACYEADYVAGTRRRAQRWVLPSDLSDYPLSVTGRKISRVVCSDSRAGG